MPDSHSRSGFTLVELAIALMVIGLLIGGVLKGQELIENAKITAAIRQLKSYDAASMIFRNTYNAVPGDIKKPNRIPNCTQQICTIPGNGNGKLDNSLDTEMYNFFPHLTKAGMIQGPEGGTSAETSSDRSKFFPDTSLEETGDLFVNFIEPVVTATGHFYIIWGITGLRAQALDIKIDDGFYNTGDTQLENAMTRGGGCGNEIDDIANITPEEYNPEDDDCASLVRAEF